MTLVCCDGETSDVEDCSAIGGTVASVALVTGGFVVTSDSGTSGAAVEVFAAGLVSFLVLVLVTIVVGVEVGAGAGAVVLLSVVCASPSVEEAPVLDTGVSSIQTTVVTVTPLVTVV